MAGCCNDSDYIKSEIDGQESPLERYRYYLAEEKGEKAAINEMSVLRRCLASIGKDAKDIGEEDIERMKGIYSHLSKRSLETYVGIVRRYVYFCTGKGSEKVKGRITYSPELMNLSDKLKREGNSAHVASEQVSRVRASLRIMNEHGMDTSPESIDADAMQKLDLFLGDKPRKERLTYIKPLGWYVLANTGTNPYLEYMARTSPNKVREIRLCRFEEELEQFRESMCEMDLSDKRKDTLVRAARQALIRLDGIVGTDYTLETLTKKELIRLRRESRDLKESTRREYLQALGMLLECVTGTNLVQQCRFRFKKVDQKRTFITEGDFNKMYRNADSEERLMLTMGVAEAMRRGEIGDLRFSNIKGDSLEFWSKGFGPDGKLSILPMMDNVRDALERYMQKRGMIVEKWGEYDPDAILLNSYGMPMSGDVVYSRLKDLAKRSGVDEFTPHSLRRFAATKMRKEGASIPDIACALRHEDPVTTMRCYLKDDPEVKAITLAKASKGLFAS